MFEKQLKSPLRSPLMRAILASSSGAGVSPALTTTITTGVAPFGIVFDGVQTTSTNPSINPVHDLVYFYDFGDASCSNYSNGVLAGSTRNKFVGGPVASFTYETPGSYTAQMWVSDGVTVWGPVTKSITVQDPDVVFAGALTTVVSTSGDFTGAPAGATQVTSSNFYSIVSNASYSGNGKRILFRRGETFTTGTAYAFNTRTDFYVGVYGAGTSYATVQATATALYPLLGGTASQPIYNSDRITITGLHFTQALASGFLGNNAIATSNKPDTTNGSDYTKGHYTIHKCKASNIASVGSLIGGCNIVVSNCVTENIREGVAGSGGVSLYLDEIQRGAVTDCNFDNSNGGEHVIRRQGGNYCTIVSNKVQRPAATKNFITMRGWQNRLSGSEVIARYNQISYNDIDGSANGSIGSYLPIEVGPQNGSAIEPISDVIVEGNYVRAHNAYAYGAAVQANTVTFRNNVFHFPSTVLASGYGISLAGTSTGAAAATNCRFLSNTFNHEATFGFSAFRQNANVPGTNQFYGNLAYAPNSIKTGANNGTAPTFMVDASASAVLLGGNSSDGQIKSTDPLFVGPTTALAGFAIQSGSPYKNAASDYKVRIDALGKLRTGSTFDAGAFNAPDKQVDAWTLIP